jgi:hypothetical protein
LLTRCCGKTHRFTIDYSSLAIHLGNGTSKTITPSNDTNVVVDTGNTFTKLDSGMVQQVYEALGATYDAAQGFALVDCAARNMTGGVTFGFGGAKGTSITVSFADFILSDGDVCLVGLTPLADGNQQILGDSFMRSAYGRWSLPFVLSATRDTGFADSKGNSGV